VAPSPPIAYLQRTRQYYQALGYGAPYVWAQVDEVPLAPLHKPLSQCRVALITTAAPYQPGLGEQRPRAGYNAAAKFYAVYSGDTANDHDVRISHVAIDFVHTTGEDIASYFPLAELRRQVVIGNRGNIGRIGALTARFHGAPTNRSQRHTREVDAPQIVKRCIEDQADAAVLVANCPVCHQTLALLACQLEAQGISTVLMGCAKDIVEHIGAPRFVFSDFPLGNAAGRPHDRASQAHTLALALDLLETARAPRTTLSSSLRWREHDDWKLDYANIERSSPAEITRLRAEFDQGRLQAQRLRVATPPTQAGDRA
jgi:D-proline reductase (dithiol) PrdB